MLAAPISERSPTEQGGFDQICNDWLTYLIEEVVYRPTEYKYKCPIIQMPITVMKEYLALALPLKSPLAEQLRVGYDSFSLPPSYQLSPPTFNSLYLLISFKDIYLLFFILRLLQIRAAGFTQRLSSMIQRDAALVSERKKFTSVSLNQTLPLFVFLGLSFAFSGALLWIESLFHRNGTQLFAIKNKVRYKDIAVCFVLGLMATLRFV